MRRRTFLSMTGVGSLTAITGCLEGDLPLPRGEVRHPFAGQTVTVTVENRSDTPHDVRSNAQQALQFWEEYAPIYAGFDIEFEHREERGDIRVIYTDSPEPCHDVEGFNEHVLGCAPIIRPGHRVSDGVSAYVVAAKRPYGKIRITTKHEIGHILGLTHDDEPREIMSNRPEDRIPLYETRLEIWNLLLEATEAAADGTSRFNQGAQFWDDGRFETATSRYDEAVDAYLTAKTNVEQAQSIAAIFVGHPTVETVALDDLEEILERLGTRMGLAVDFASHMAAAATHRAEDEPELANERVSLANDSIRAFNEMQSVELRSVAIALGLVRGFDRDEAVITT